MNCKVKQCCAALAEIKPRQPEAAAEAQPQAPGSDT